MKNLKYLFLTVALITTPTTYTMKRKAEKPIDTKVLHKRARTSDTIAHQLWTEYAINSKYTLQNKFDEIITFFKNRHTSDPAITQARSIENLLIILKDKKDLKKCYKKLKNFKAGVDSAQAATRCLSSLEGTQVFTDTINVLLTSEFSKPREQVLSAFQQTSFIIEYAIKDLYNTDIATHNNNQTFAQLLANHNNDFGTTVLSIQQTAGNLLHNGVIQQDRYAHLLNLVSGRQSALDAINIESKLDNQLQKMK